MAYTTWKTLKRDRSYYLEVPATSLGGRCPIVVYKANNKANPQVGKLIRLFEM